MQRVLDNGGFEGGCVGQCDAVCNHRACYRDFSVDLERNRCICDPVGATYECDPDTETCENDTCVPAGPPTGAPTGTPTVQPTVEPTGQPTCDDNTADQDPTATCPCFTLEEATSGIVTASRHDDEEFATRVFGTDTSGTSVSYATVLTTDSSNPDNRVVGCEVRSNGAATVSIPSITPDQFSACRVIVRTVAADKGIRQPSCEPCPCFSAMELQTSPDPLTACRIDKVPDPLASAAILGGGTPRSPVLPIYSTSYNSDSFAFTVEAGCSYRKADGSTATILFNAIEPFEACQRIIEEECARRNLPQV